MPSLPHLSSFDIIVIGSGISGLNFALRAAEKGLKVLVATKKKVAQASTNFAQGGIAAVLTKTDNFKKHVQDTLIAGYFHNNKKAVSYMVKNGPKAIARLIELGVPFANLRGKLLLTHEGGHSRRRIAFVSDYTGEAIEKVLVAKAKKHPNIVLQEHAFAVDLIVKNRVCAGVKILRGGRLYNIYAGATVLATGGAGQIYSHTTNPAISTADGIAMAARAGCRCEDLEFVQFHPTALNLKGKPKFLISEAVRGEGARLRNSKSERFMPAVHPMAELAPRDIVARAIYEQEKNGPVYLDLRHKNPNFIKTRFPQIYQKLKQYGIDMAKDLIPVSPAAHYFCGGIKVNLRGQTGIKNLYAFGETACTGVHGANRLASNSLLEALVFSDRILANDLLRGKTKNLPQKTAKIGKIPAKTAGKLAKMRKQLRQIMWANVGVIRTTESLQKALWEIKNLQKRAAGIKTLGEAAFELKNMLTAAELVTKSALQRKRSLGCHCRV